MCFCLKTFFTLTNRLDPDEMQYWCIPEYKLLMKGVLTHFCWMYFPIFLSLSTGSIPRLRQEVQILEFKKQSIGCAFS